MEHFWTYTHRLQETNAISRDTHLDFIARQPMRRLELNEKETKSSRMLERIEAWCYIPPGPA